MNISPYENYNYLQPEALKAFWPINLYTKQPGLNKLADANYSLNPDEMDTLHQGLMAGGQNIWKIY